jgi:hypothetical protein
MADAITPQCEALGARIAASLGEHLGIPYEDGKKRFTALLQAEVEHAAPSGSNDRPALILHLEKLTADAAGWRTAYEKVTAKARRFQWAWQSARRGRRSGRLLNRELVASYEATLRRVTAERDEAREERNSALNELALAMGPTMYHQIQQILDGVLGGRREDGAGAGLVAEIQLLADRLESAESGERAADSQVEQLRAELDAIRTRDETVGGVLYDVVRRCQTGELDEHQAVRAIDARLIHPLVAKLQEARAKASRGADRRRTGAAQLGSVRAERGRLAQLVRDLTDPDPCYFDHHGGCQAHGYLSLKPGEKCPHAEAKELRHEAHIARTRAPRKERP